MKTLILITLAGVLCGCTTSTIIHLAPSRPPTDPKNVRILTKPPLKYEELAIITAESTAGWTYQQAQDNAVIELQRKAAALGANAVLLMDSGKENNGYVGGVSPGGGFYAVPSETMKAKGRAIWVEDD